MELAEKSTAGSVTPSGAIVRMFYEPSAVFAQLETRRSTWVPLVLLLLSAVVLASWYYQFVDYAWLQERFLSVVTDPEAREKQREMGGMSVGTLTGITIVGVIVAYLVGFALVALYLLIVSKVRNSPFSFGQGFSLAVWASVPNLLLLVLGAMQIMLASSNQISFESLNPLTLNQLFFHHDVTHPMAGLLEGVSVLMLWNMFLLVIGYQAWAKVKRSTAAAIVITPYVVVYGLWLAYAMSRTA